MNKSIRALYRFTFVSLLLPVATALGQFNYAPVLLPFPQADYSYPTASYPVADPADEDSSAGTWRYPASTQPKSVGSIQTVAGLELSAAPADLKDISFTQRDIGAQAGQLGKLTCDCHTCANTESDCVPCSGWFGSIAALFMTRDEGGRYQFSYDNDPLGSRDHIHLLDIREADMGYSGGFDVRIGHYFHGGQLGIELIYWGLYPGSKQSILTPTGFVGTLDPILNFDRVSIGGTGVDAWTDGADAHRIRRSFDIHNAEINVLNFSGCTIYDACGRPRFGFSWGAGFRFFQFSEELVFSAREAGTGVTFDDNQNQIDYSVDVDNNLFGGQIGGEGRWFATEKMSIVLSCKVGLFGNSIQHRSRIQDEQGRIAIVNDGPLDGAAWDVNSHKGDVAVLAELNLGLSYCLIRNISLIAAYRLVGVSGVALSAEQIPNDLRRVNDAYTIDSDNGLVLHGGHAGIEFLY